MTYPDYYCPPNIPISGWDRIVLFSMPLAPRRSSRELYGIAFIINPNTVYYLEYCGLIYSITLSCPVWDALVDLNSRLNSNIVDSVRLVLNTNLGIVIGHDYRYRTTVFTCKPLSELYDYIRSLQLLEML